MAKNKLTTGKWSGTEDSVIKRLYKDHSIEQIANILNRSYGMIAFRKNQLGLIVAPREHWSASEVEILKLLHSQKVNNSEIAKTLGRGYPAVVCKIGRLNLPLNCVRWTPELTDKLAKLYNSGCTYKEIAESLGITLTSVRSRLSNTAR
jgi:DNA-binding CsgD family transcriptional regulator